MKRRSLSIAFGFLLVVAMLGGLGLLIWKTSSLGDNNRSQFGSAVRDLKELDKEWGLDLLRAKSQIIKNYDPLSGPLPQLSRVQSTLKTIAAASDSASTAPLDAVGKAFGEKTDLIDSFKMQDSLLKNSLRFLPTAVAQLKDELHKPIVKKMRRSARAAMIATRQEIERAVDRLLTGALQYDLTTDASAKQAVEDALVYLGRGRHLDTNEIADAIDIAANHARVILRQKASEEAVLSAIYQVPTSTRIDELASSYEKVFDAKLKVQDYWRRALILYSGVVLLMLLFSAFKLYASYRSLNIANGLLASANSSLEARVQERTRELTGALRAAKESQLQLIQAEKMSSLGQMVAGVAHEINTPLAYVKNSVELARRRMKDMDVLISEGAKYIATTRQLNGSNTGQSNPHFHSLADMISDFVEMDTIKELDDLLGDGGHGIDEISSIVGHLKDFSRLDRSNIDSYNVNDGVRSTLKIAQNLVKKRKVSTNLADIPSILCSPVQINQVLLNLVSNACQATAEGMGEVHVSTRAHRDGVVIQVKDNGHGMTEEVKSKIFDPFFTTKKVGEGTGLGLSIVHRIVVEHGGQISVSSVVGQGSIFSIYLPARHERKQDAESSLSNAPVAV